MGNSVPFLMKAGVCVVAFFWLKSWILSPFSYFSGEGIIQKTFDGLGDAVRDGANDIKNGNGSRAAYGLAIVGVSSFVFLTKYWDKICYLFGGDDNDEPSTAGTGRTKSARSTSKNSRYTKKRDTPSSDDEDGMSVGAIVAIAIASIGVIAFVSVAVWACCRNSTCRSGHLPGDYYGD